MLHKIYAKHRMFVLFCETQIIIIYVSDRTSSSQFINTYT